MSGADFADDTVCSEQTEPTGYFTADPLALFGVFDGRIQDGSQVFVAKAVDLVFPAREKLKALVVFSLPRVYRPV